MFTASGIVITGLVTREPRSVTFKTGPATFLELLMQFPDRASQTAEIKLAQDMDVAQFVKGTEVSIAVAIGAKDSRIYYSALRIQPEGLPHIKAAA